MDLHALTVVANQAERHIANNDRRVFFTSEGLYIDCEYATEFIKRCEVDLSDFLNQKNIKKVSKRVKSLGWDTKYVIYPEGVTLCLFSPSFSPVKEICPDLIRRDIQMIMNSSFLHEKDSIHWDYQLVDENDSPTYIFSVGKRNYGIRRSLLKETFPSLVFDCWIKQILFKSARYRLQLLTTMMMHGQQIEILNDCFPSGCIFKYMHHHLLVMNNDRRLIEVIPLEKVQGVRGFSRPEGSVNTSILLPKMKKYFSLEGESDFPVARVLKKGIFLEGKNAPEKFLSEIGPVHIKYLRKAQITLGNDTKEGFFILDREAVEWLGWYTTEAVIIHPFVEISLLEEVIQNNSTTRKSNRRSCVVAFDSPYGEVHVTEHAYTRYLERNGKIYSDKVKYLKDMIKSIQNAHEVRRDNYIRQIIKHHFKTARYLMYGNWIFVMDETNKIKTCYPKSLNPLECGYSLIEEETIKN